jgi:hypothetical protein
MKHKKFFFASLFSLFFAVVALFSCNKNQDCVGIIYTQMVDETTGIETPIGGCNVVIGLKEFADSVYREVITDASGRYEGRWLRDASLPVSVTKQFSPSQYYYGVGFLRLERGNITELKIPLVLLNY